MCRDSTSARSNGRDQAVINQLTATTANPFYGLADQHLDQHHHLSVAQLLSRYPEFATGATSPGSSGVVMNDNNVGSSEYNSFNFRIQRRLTHGLSLMGNFMQSKMIDQTSWLNDSDPTPEKRISPFFRPTRLALAAIYEIPVGRGRLVNIKSHLLDYVDWRLADCRHLQFPAWRTPDMVERQHQ